MSASWLITDGFSGEAGGVNKIVTLGLYSADAPTPPVITFNNATMNWLSPTPHLLLALGALLYLYRMSP